MSKKKLFLIILTGFVLLLSEILVAQTGLPEPENKSPNPPPPGLVVSIDMGIPLLLIAGLFLGIYWKNIFNLSKPIP